MPFKNYDKLGSEPSLEDLCRNQSLSSGGEEQLTSRRRVLPNPIYAKARALLGGHSHRTIFVSICPSKPWAYKHSVGFLSRTFLSMAPNWESPLPPPISWRIRLDMWLQKLKLTAPNPDLRRTPATQSGADFLTLLYYIDKCRGLERRKSLSIGASQHGIRRCKRKEKISGQTASLLLSTMPLEIRLMIYQYALDEMEAVLLQIKEHKFCTIQYKKLRTTQCELFYDDQTGELLDTEARSELDQPLIFSPVPLLRACRLIYVEALPILYSTTQFVIDSYCAYKCLTYMIPSSHVEKIRYIRVNGISKDALAIVRSLNHAYNLQVVCRMCVFRSKPSEHSVNAQKYRKPLLEAASTLCTVDLWVFIEAVALNSSIIELLGHHSTFPGLRDPLGNDK